MFRKRKEKETAKIYVEKRTGHVIGSTYDPSAPVSDQWRRHGKCDICRRADYCGKECRAAKDRRLLADRAARDAASGKSTIMKTGRK